MIQKTCVVCGDSLEARRADAQTCSVRCRASKSRRARDPEIGSPERRENQREGLDRKFVYPKIVDDLQARGLVQVNRGPRDWDGDRVNEDGLQFGTSWHPADGWWLSEPRTVGPSVVEIHESVYKE